MKLLIFLILGLISLAASAVLTHLMRKRLLAKNIMDQPNERSMHETPVPRGGGLALLIVFIAGLLLVMPVAGSPAIWLLAALGALGWICWRDDKKGAGISVRLGVQALAAILGSQALGNDATIFGDLLPFWLDRAVLIIGWMWFMNLYNFMDGIDGITGMQSFACALGVAIIFASSGHYELMMLALPAIICGACIGFLLFNWHPAQIFLGDVGSIPLGFLVGFLLFKLAVMGMIFPALILPLYYLADSGLTIIKRLVRREKIWEPHKQHFYQQAAQIVGQHDKIVLWIFIANVALIILAALALVWPYVSFCASLLVIAQLLIKMRKTNTQN